ncbi:MAG: DciA family protein [Pseudomonadota bacterium]
MDDAGRFSPQRTTGDAARLQRLRDEVNRLLDATQRLRGHLDPVFGEHCSIARLTPTEVVVMVDSAAWASRIRYLLPQIEQLFTDMGRCRATVKVASAVAASPPSRRHVLSADGRAALEAAARTVENPALQAVLKRIAKPGAGC